MKNVFKGFGLAQEQTKFSTGVQTKYPNTMAENYIANISSDDEKKLIKEGIADYTRNKNEYAIINAGVICDASEERYAEFTYKSDFDDKFTLVDKYLEARLLSDAGNIKFDDSEIYLYSHNAIVAKISLLIFKGIVSKFKKGVLDDIYEMNGYDEDYDEYFADYPSNRLEVETIRTFIKNKEQNDEVCLIIAKIEQKAANYLDFISDTINAIPQMVRTLNLGFDKIDSVVVI